MIVNHNLKNPKVIVQGLNICNKKENLLLGYNAQSDKVHICF